MTKNDMIEQIAKTEGMTKTQAARVVDLVFEAIELATMEDGEKVTIRGFGTFYPYMIDRSGKAPDGTPYHVKRATIKFRGSKTLS
ncbi:MAG: HU family DNA-binding protein [Halobacteriota archaeon]|nr:HU family DNA-binding protein [Halobacteriota archaeon]